MQAVYWPLLYSPLTEESLWLSGTESERKSEGLRFDSSWVLRRFLRPTLVRKRKNIFLNSSPHSKHTNRLWWYKQYAGRVSLELCNSPCSPKSLCGSVVQNRSANPNVWGSIPHGDSEFYFVTHLWQDEKTSLLILHRAQNIPIDFGDTSGMQDACHQNFVIVPAHRRVFVAQWHSIGAQIRRSEVRFFMGTQNITLSHARDKTKTFFSIRHRAQNIPIDFGDTSGIQDACH